LLPNDLRLTIALCFDIQICACNLTIKKEKKMENEENAEKTQDLAEVERFVREKIQSQDFSFLNHLPTMQKRVILLIIGEALSKGDLFAEIGKFSQLLIDQKITTSHLTFLKRRGIIHHNFEAGTWRLDPSFLKAGKPPKAYRSSGQNVQVDKKGKLVGKMASLYQYLKKEKVGSELMMTSEIIRDCGEKLNTRKSYIWQMLSHLETHHGLIKRIKNQKGKGTFVVFIEEGATQEKIPLDIRVSELIKKSESISQALAEKISSKKLELSELEAKLEKENQFLAELKARL